MKQLIIFICLWACQGQLNEANATEQREIISVDPNKSDMGIIPFERAIPESQSPSIEDLEGKINLLKISRNDEQAIAATQEKRGRSRREKMRRPWKKRNALLKDPAYHTIRKHLPHAETLEEDQGAIKAKKGEEKLSALGRREEESLLSSLDGITSNKSRLGKLAFQIDNPRIKEIKDPGRISDSFKYKKGKASKSQELTEADLTKTVQNPVYDESTLQGSDKEDLEEWEKAS